MNDPAPTQGPVERGSPEWHRRVQAYTQQVAADIAAHGFVVQGVMPTVDEPDACDEFAYTIGLTEAGLPELLIAGLPIEVSGQMLHAAAQQHCREELRPDTLFAFPETAMTVEFDCRVKAIPAGDSCLGNAYRIYGPSVRGLQLVFPDGHGRFPGDSGYEGPLQVTG